ncbi:hypothetical protein OHA_1_02081 [Pleomorphomonas sp. SM30]|uniref:Uncharacterized protein n=1 Tax=Oharaeibacter diazotrophicus TaxID=1920512 RepID=A0A4R6R9U2_9HYPH|nr:hypothetical protein EDD54_4024 [Oharaeibacter diazotrophicus]BBE72486.1 hypothetical protein OHA_1_02081 [Pleomorphomonas sp. SM30]GLS76517.1 hypothetical protein GCM10007904_18540 [Oharaeibacter diazotrophicus]
MRARLNHGRDGNLDRRRRLPPPDRNLGRTNPMFRGALLWLVGIPLPIILILWLMGYLS